MQKPSKQYTECCPSEAEHQRSKCVRGSNSVKSVTPKWKSPGEDVSDRRQDPQKQPFSAGENNVTPIDTVSRQARVHVGLKSVEDGRHKTRHRDQQPVRPRPILFR